MSDDAVFRALVDSSRRELLDRLRERDGRTSQDLCRGLAISRQAVAKHLSVLEEAGLVSTRWKGREKLHFVNAIPIADAAEGWMAKFKRPLPPLRSLARRDDIASAPASTSLAADAGTLSPRSLRALVQKDQVEEANEDEVIRSRQVAHPRATASPAATIDEATGKRLNLRSLVRLKRTDDE